MTKTLDVVGIGNAIVDVLAYTPDRFIEEQAMKKGAMMLVDEVRSREVYDAMGPGMECSGGSVANTMAGIAGLGGSGAFIGKVFDDALGDIFRRDLRSAGVRFDTRPAKTGKATACCLICVTPDAQRTMNTFLGACSLIDPKDIDEGLIASAQVLYIEGYLWDHPTTKEALRKAAEVAKKQGVQVAFSLSDTFCVERHRAEFLALIDSHIDILFANEAEIKALTQTEVFDAAKEAVRPRVSLAALTRGPGGSVLVRGKEEVQVHAEGRGEVVDTTGAGDLYAAGVLYGLTHGYTLLKTGRLASRLAGHIITQLGARSGVDLDKVAGELLA